MAFGLALAEQGLNLVEIIVVLPLVSDYGEAGLLENFVGAGQRESIALSHVLYGGVSLAVHIFPTVHLASTFYRTVARSHKLMRSCLLFPFSVMVPITIGWCRVEELVHVRASDEGLLVCCDGRNHSVLEIAVGCPKANSKIKGKSPWRKNVSK